MSRCRRCVIKAAPGGRRDQAALGGVLVNPAAGNNSGGLQDMEESLYPGVIAGDGSAAVDNLVTALWWDSEDGVFHWEVSSPEGVVAYGTAGDAGDAARELKRVYEGLLGYGGEFAG